MSAARFRILEKATIIVLTLLPLGCTEKTSLGQDPKPGSMPGTGGTWSGVSGGAGGSMAGGAGGSGTGGSTGGRAMGGTGGISTGGAGSAATASTGGTWAGGAGGGAISGTVGASSGGADGAVIIGTVGASSGGADGAVIIGTGGVSTGGVGGAVSVGTGGVATGGTGGTGGAVPYGSLCPSQPIGESFACTRPNDETCWYQDCSGTGKISFATCAGGSWLYGSNPCPATECGETNCLKGQICLQTQGASSFSCVTPTCKIGPITTDCVPGASSSCTLKVISDVGLWMICND